MSVITISRGSFSLGQAVAQGVADRLGYECLSREVLLEAGDEFDVPQTTLENAIKDAPSFLQRITRSKQEHIAYIQSALTRRVLHDNVVYHGLAGHLFLKNVSHVLKVRIVADMQLRVANYVKRLKVTEAEALAAIAKIDKERKKWTKTQFSVDPSDPHLYDLILNISRYKVDEAVELICRSVEMEVFKTTPESERQMADLALACQVKAALVEEHRDVSVSCTFGNVVIYGTPEDRNQGGLNAELQKVLEKIEGINNLEIHADVEPPETAV